VALCPRHFFPGLPQPGYYFGFVLALRGPRLGLALRPALSDQSPLTAPYDTAVCANCFPKNLRLGLGHPLAVAGVELGFGAIKPGPLQPRSHLGDSLYPISLDDSLPHARARRPGLDPGFCRCRFYLADYYVGFGAE